METRLYVQLDDRVVSQLACPACRGDLQCLASHLVCGACGRSYPVVDGISVLIAERAETPDEVR